MFVGWIMEYCLLALMMTPIIHRLIIWSPMSGPLCLMLSRLFIKGYKITGYNSILCYCNCWWVFIEWVFRFVLMHSSHNINPKLIILQNSPQYMTQTGFKPASMRTTNHLIIDFTIADKIDYNKHHNGAVYITLWNEQK